MYRPQGTCKFCGAFTDFRGEGVCDACKKKFYKHCKEFRIKNLKKRKQKRTSKKLRM